MVPETVLGHWREGAEHFNHGRYWQAHESWEQGWTRLEPVPKLRVQAMIQVAAVLHHLERGRTDPARRLARLALEKLAAGGEGQASGGPRISIEGAAEFLDGILTGAPSNEPTKAAREAGKRLRARVE